MALKDHCLSHVAPKATLPHDVMMLAYCLHYTLHI